MISFKKLSKRTRAADAKTTKWLTSYLEGKNISFPYPIDAEGTIFQKSVWRELGKIPYGTVRSYGEIADKLKKAGAARAVGQACGANPLPLIIPCHRVVAGNGIGGFSGGLGIKKKLLKLEQK